VQAPALSHECGIVASEVLDFRQILLGKPLTAADSSGA